MHLNLFFNFNNLNLCFSKILFILFIVILIYEIGVSSSSKEADWYIQARCQAACLHAKKDELSSCRNICNEENFTKPGYCSHHPSGFQRACIKECFTDHSCPGVDKCCPNECGFTCQIPDNITQFTGVPQLVHKITVKIDGKTAIINWDLDNDVKRSMSNETVYVLEERRYIGRKYRQQLMGAWNTLLKKPALGPPVMMPMKPATWYEVRIATVSKNGSAGFSQPSQPFKSPVAPKPPDTPQNLTFSKAVIKNGTLWGVFSWSAPVSELPVSKYTVYWSKRIVSDLSLTNKGSLKVNTKVVPSEKTSLKIKRLDLKTKYNIQVRAQVQYGKEKMYSDIVGITINPAEFAGFVKGKNEKLTKGRFHIPVRVSKVTEQNGQLSAKVIWRGRDHVNYVVLWESSCPGNDTAENVSMNSLVVRGTQLEIKSLIPKCTYHVYVRKDKTRRKKTPSGKTSFVADPNCSQLPPNKC